jgi:hypothetical protein
MLYTECMTPANQELEAEVKRLKAALKAETQTVTWLNAQLGKARGEAVVLLIGSLNILVLAVIYSKWLTVISMVLLAISQAILLYLYTDRRS